MGLHLKNLEFTLPKDALCKFWLKLVVLKGRFLNIFNIIFYFAIISPWKRAWPFN